MKLGKTSIWMHLYEVSDKCYIDHSLFILLYINHKFISALKMFLLCLGVFMMLIFAIERKLSPSEFKEGDSS